MDKNRIMVSIIVPVYNHEKYIKKALDSILMQKTAFRYEVLVGEDCSTDKSKEVLMNYEKQHPGFLKVYYRKENLRKIKAQYGNSLDLKLKSKGKYIITLEGDDYWIDENKLQKQVDFLEMNNEYIAVAHNCIVVDRDGNYLNHLYPECKDEEYSLKHFISGIMPGQLTTVMMRNFFVDKKIEFELLQKRLSPGDRLLYFTLISQGKIKCLQHRMSAYRFVTSNSSSFSSNFRYDFFKFAEYYEEMYNHARKINYYYAYKYIGLLQLRNIFRGIKYQKISIKTIIRFHHLVHKKGGAYYLLLKELYNIKIRQKEFAKDIIV